MADDGIICEHRGAAGLLRLNRPAALNALTLDMVRAISEALDVWEADPAVERVVIAGAGDRAFCAGGDIRLLHDQGRAGLHAEQLAFWREEYTLNHRIHRYRKPYVALIDGIVMGGGVGVSLHGRHRVAGDRFAFAMPEVGIGFFPDVGATWFLPRLPGAAGTWLALTGARIKAGDGLHLGLATDFVPSDRMAELAEALCESGDTDDILAAYRTAAPPAAHVADAAVIDACFGQPDLESIAAALRIAAAQGSAVAAGALAAFQTKSPVSLGIALRQMQIGASLSLEAAMMAEFRIVSRVCRGHDFYEGVRALILDRDQSPHWTPERIGDISSAMIDSYFAPLGQDELVLPATPA